MIIKVSFDPNYSLILSYFLLTAERSKTILFFQAQTPISNCQETDLMVCHAHTNGTGSRGRQSTQHMAMANAFLLRKINKNTFRE